MSGVTLVRRNGERIEAEGVRYDRDAIHALVIEHEAVVDEATRIAHWVPVRETWRSLLRSDVKSIRPRAQR